MTRSMLVRLSAPLALSAILAVSATGSASARDTVVVRDHRTPNVIVRDHRTPNVVVRDHRGEAPVYRPVRHDPRYPTWGTAYGPRRDPLRCGRHACPTVRDHRDGR